VAGLLIGKVVVSFLSLHLSGLQNPPWYQRGPQVGVGAYFFVPQSVTPQAPVRLTALFSTSGGPCGLEATLVQAREERERERENTQNSSDAVVQDGACSW
jgi:hypothetical protein